jgi:hypothetical protein
MCSLAHCSMDSIEVLVCKGVAILCEFVRQGTAEYVGKPKTLRAPAQKLVREYAVVEEKRGGSHAAYGRTARDIGPRLVREGGEIVLRSLP